MLKYQFVADLRQTDQEIMLPTDDGGEQRMRAGEIRRLRRNNNACTAAFEFRKQTWGSCRLDYFSYRSSMINSCILYAGNRRDD